MIVNIRRSASTAGRFLCLLLPLCASAQDVPLSPQQALEQLLAADNRIERPAGTADALPPSVDARHRAAKSLVVRRGDTLDLIVRRVYGDVGLNRSAVFRAIVSANPHAFARGNPSRIIAGATLRFPGASNAGASNAGPSSSPAAGAGSGDHAGTKTGGGRGRDASSDTWVRYP